MMNREEAIEMWVIPALKNTWNEKKCNEILEALDQEPCDELDFVQPHKKMSVNLNIEEPSQPKTGYISIDDVMSVFDDFMCEEVDEDGMNTFLEMLKDKAESKDKDCKEIVSFIMKEKYKRRNENLVVLINKDIERNVKNLIVEWEENYPCLISYNRTLCGLPIVVMEVDDVKVVTFEEYKKRCRSEE